jgi:hypothetical protein
VRACRERGVESLLIDAGVTPSALDLPADSALDVTEVLAG